MSAPTPAPGDDRPRDGYYPDPSIPGYVRYWNGAAWVPGTSRPAPSAGESLPVPPGANPAPHTADETGPLFFDEEPPQQSVVPEQSAPPDQRPADRSGAPAETAAAEPGPAEAARHGGRPEPASAWGADASRQSGFGGEQDQRVSWGAPQGADPRVPRGDGPAKPEEPAQRADGTMLIRPTPDDGPAAGEATADERSSRTTSQDGPVAGPGAEAGRTTAAGAPDSVSEGTVVFQRPVIGRGTPADPAPRPSATADRGVADAAGGGEGTMAIRREQSAAQGPAAGPAGSARGRIPQQAAGAAAGPYTGPGTPPSGPAVPQVPGQYGYPPVANPGGPGQYGYPPAASPGTAGQYGYPPAASPAGPGQYGYPPVANPGGPGQYGYPPATSPGTAGQYGYPPAAGPAGPGQYGYPPAARQPASGSDEPVVPWKPPVDDPFLAAARAQAAARPASLGRRFAARLLDTLVVGAVTAAAGVPLISGAVDHINDKVDAAKLSGETVTVWLLDGTTGVSLGIVLAVLLVFGALYEALPTAKWGRTLGKKLLGLQVRDIEAHEPPKLGAALRRWLVLSVPVLLLIGLVGVLWCLFDRPWRQCWHDKAAHTFVAA